MKTMPEIRQQNLKVLETIYESQRILADILDTTPGYINQLLTGRRNIGERTARKIEKSTGKPAYWMDVLHNQDDACTEGEIKLPLSSQLENMKLGIARIPLIDFNRAGSWREELRNHIPSNGDLMITGYVGKNVFAVQVPGDSMKPEFDKGETILIDPDSTPEHEDFVIAELGGDLSLRQYWREAGEWYLKPLNERYAMALLGDNPIIGVVTDKVIRKKYK